MRDRNYGDVLGKFDVAIAVVHSFKNRALKNDSGSAERHSSYCFDVVRITGSFSQYAPPFNQSILLNSHVILDCVGSYC